MKICFLATSKSIHSYKWVSYFARIGHEVIWLSTSENEFDDVEGLTFYKLRSPFILSLIDTKKIINSLKPDLVHAHYIGKYGLIAALSGFDKLVTTAWGSDIIFNSKSFFKKIMINFILKKSLIITCDALHLRNKILQLGTHDSKIRIIYFGIDSEKFKPQVNIKKNSDNVVNIISMRDFEKIYDVETLILAANEVLKTRPNVFFMLGGRGTEKYYLESLIKKHQLENNFQFIGYVPQVDLPKLYNLADICVSTSLSDAGIAASTAEAMACGLPVIVTNTGENNLWIDNEINGYLFKSKNYEELASKIIYLIDSPEKRKLMGINNREKISKGNSYEVEMEKMNLIYDELN